MAGRKPVTFATPHQPAQCLRSTHGRWALAAAASLAFGLALTTSTNAHNGVDHATDAEAKAHLELDENTPGFPTIKGGNFRLIDQNGNERTSKDPDGHHQLLFFGYAHCKAICSVALPRLAEAVDKLAADGIVVTPLLITVDPERDTITNLAEASPKIHPRLVGLTGDQEALAEAYDAFQVERKVVFEHPEHGPVYAHGSYIYLLGPDGGFKTLMPPILSPDRIAELVTRYVKGNPG